MCHWFYASASPIFALSASASFLPWFLCLTVFLSMGAILNSFVFIPRLEGNRNSCSFSCRDKVNAGFDYGDMNEFVISRY